MFLGSSQTHVPNFTQWKGLLQRGCPGLRPLPAPGWGREHLGNGDEITTVIPSFIGQAATGSYSIPPRAAATTTHISPPPPPALRPLSLLPISLKLPVCCIHKNYSPYLSIHDVHSSHCWMERPVWVKRSTRLPGRILSAPGGHHVSVLASIWKIRQHSPTKDANSNVSASRPGAEAGAAPLPPLTSTWTSHARKMFTVCRTAGKLQRNPTIYILQMYNRNDTKQKCFLENRLMAQYSKYIHFTF